MVKVVDGGAWRGSLFVLLLGVSAVANACGGRTVWVDETGDASDSGGGVSGRGGNDNGGDAGDYGGGGYTGGYGGDYGGGGYTGGYGGDYGGGGYTGGDAGAYGGGGYPGGYGGTYGGTYGGGGFTGGVAGKGGYGGTITGGYGGTFAGSAGVGGKGGCGAASGSGGSAGSSPLLGKACSLFCTRYPYSSCPSDLTGPADCISQCRSGFGLGSWCQPALVDFLLCAGQVLEPNAMCSEQGGGVCAGPGCMSDALNVCGLEYYALLECQASPRPVPPCPPPPDPPLPPNCSGTASSSEGMCMREVVCPNGNASLTECRYLYDMSGTWSCECYSNGNFVGAAAFNGTSDPCRQSAAFCGLY